MDNYKFNTLTNTPFRLYYYRYTRCTYSDYLYVLPLHCKMEGSLLVDVLDIRVGTLKG